MGDDDRYNIYVFEYLKTIFKKNEKPKQGDWDNMTRFEKFEEFRQHMAYYKKKWVGFHILSTIFKHISFISIFINFLFFWWIGFFYLLSIIFGTFSLLWLLHLIFYKKYRWNMMEYRSFEWFLMNSEYI